MPIVTITSNPALDIAANVDAVRPTEKLRCSEPLVNAGGGGINVARVARRFGADVVAVVASGGLTGKRIVERAAAEDLDVRSVPIAGESRESFTVTQRTDGLQYRFVLPGPRITPDEEAAIIRTVAQISPRGFVVHSGSLPVETSSGYLAALAADAARVGARFVLDGPGDVLTGTRGTFLLKPNLVELETMAGRSLRNRHDQVRFAREIVADGVAQHVVVSLGEEGALLVGSDEAFSYQAPEATLVSAVGAGDSMVGAMVAALDGGIPLADAVARGVAAGTAALLTPGTELCDPDQAMRLYAEVRREAVDVTTRTSTHVSPG